MASASENNDTNLSIDENNDIAHDIDDIENLINGSEDGGVIQLDEEYELQSNKTMTINKSVTINGVENKTVIDGNGNYLYLDAPEKEVAVEESGVIIIGPMDDLKNTGKHIVFNNITFKNVHLETWHEMEFNNCSFIDSTFTSHELDNRFDNCIFINSTAELVVYQGYLLHTYVFNEFINCRFIETEFITKNYYGSFYLYRVGSDFFEIYDSIRLVNCSFYESEITVYHITINITDCSFNLTDIKGHSDVINVENSEFYSQTTDISICKSNFTDSTFNNSNIYLEASFFSIGSSTNLNHCALSNAKIRLTPGFRSAKSQISITDSTVENSSVDSTDATVNVRNSTFTGIRFLLFISSLKISDSTICNNDTLDNTFKTKIQDEKEVIADGNLTNITIKYQVKTDYEINNTYFINETGKHQLNAEDISENTLYRFTCIKQDVYYLNGQLIFELKDAEGNPVAGETIFVSIPDRYQPTIPSITTDENGIAAYDLTETGKFTIRAYYYSPKWDFDSFTHSITFNITVKQVVDDLKVDKCDFNTNIYSNIESWLMLKISSKVLGELDGIKLTVKLTGKNKNKVYRLYTDFDGETFFDMPTKLAAGSYKIRITVANTNIVKTIKFKIKKAKTIVKATETTNKLKKSAYFKVTVKNKISKRAVSNVKVKIKVYTGKKFKTFIAKTNKKGIAKINTKTLKSGSHKVVISSANSNYEMSATSMIKIKK